MIHIVAENQRLGREMKELLVRPNQKVRIYSTGNSLRGVSVQPDDELIVNLVSAEQKREILPVLQACLIPALYE
jgi:hypothetical protein